MDKVSLIGYIAATLTTFAFLPQMIKTIRYKETKDISLGMYVIFVIGISAWLIYGFLLNAMPIILANIVSFCLAFTILILKIKYK
ncbi:MAG: SemiSWEET transporter [Candidatus Kapaibacteriota bacterium]